MFVFFFFFFQAEDGIRDGHVTGVQTCALPILTPFGFQSERRTLWQALEMYVKVSPFLFADKIKAPILLIHGEADNNSGTFPMQSDRMYRAIKGNGGAVRYVTLPDEAHRYTARESIEDVVWEMLTWFNKFVKNAGSGEASPKALTI